MSLDIRHPDDKALDSMDAEIQAEAERIAREDSERGCHLGWKVDFNSPSINFSEQCIDIVRDAAKEVVPESQIRDLYSGAGHDRYVRLISATNG